jgi:hypothetical protein
MQTDAIGTLGRAVDALGGGLGIHDAHIRDTTGIASL